MKKMMILALVAGCGSTTTSRTHLVGPGRKSFDRPQSEVHDKILITMRSLVYDVKEDRGDEILCVVPVDKIPGVVFSVDLAAKKTYFLRARLDGDTEVNFEFFCRKTGLVSEERDPIIDNNDVAFFENFWKEAKKHGLD